MSEERTTVLYILGVSRSGSTVVGYGLGAHDDVCFVGEMANTPARGWKGERLCSCGARWDECAFWSRVRAELERRLGPHDRDRYVAIRDRFEPYQLDAAGWMRLARLRPERDPDFARYAETMGALFDSIRIASGKRLIVDSSKDPGRALALAHAPGIDVVLVHVVRDARGVAFSMAKSFERDVAKGVYAAHPAESVLRASALWSLTNGLCELACRAVPKRRVIRLRYEDFVNDPERELQRVGAIAGLDYSSVARRIVAGESLPAAHLLNGNRMRMSSGIKLRPDRQWESGLARRQRLKVQLMAGPLLRYYGY